MGTFSDATAVYGLSAAGTPTGTNVGGTNTIGVGSTKNAITGADIAYSFKVTSTGIGDVATLTLSSGSVAQTTGTPTITDGDGKDFEGDTLTTMVTLNAVLVQRTTSVSTVVMESSPAQLPDFQTLGDSDATATVLWEGTDTNLGTIAFTFGAPADSVTVTIIGKSS